MSIDAEIQSDDTFTFVDDVPEKGNPINSASEFTCEVCGTDLVYSGRGRKPKRCDEHKRGRSSASTSRGSRASSAVIDRAITELTMLYTVGGQGLKFASPVAGELVYNNAEKLAESYRLLLETNARFRKLFQNMESKAAWLPILIAHGELVANIWIATGLAKLNRETESQNDDAQLF